MKLAAFYSRESARERLGIVDPTGTRVLDVSATVPTVRAWLYRVEDLQAVWDTATPEDPRWRTLADISLAPPLRRPGKIVAIGLNYREHIEEQDGKIPERPIIFAKFPSAVLAHNESIRIPAISSQIDYEAELAVVIGRTCRNVRPSEVRGFIAGYTILNDVTARDLQKSDRQWIRAKSLDTFCPLGPWLVTTEAMEFPPQRDIVLTVNGETRQSSNTRMMMHDVAALVSWLSESFTLEPGDVIATGTPSGVGGYRTPPEFLKAGDVVSITIDGIGTLTNPVV